MLDKYKSECFRQEGEFIRQFIVYMMTLIEGNEESNLKKETRSDRLEFIGCDVVDIYLK